MRHCGSISLPSYRLCLRQPRRETSLDCAGGAETEHVDEPICHADGTGHCARSLAAAVFLAPLLLSACASKDDMDLAAYADTVDPADVLYNQGLANLNAGPHEGGDRQVRRRSTASIPTRTTRARR